MRKLYETNMKVVRNKGNKNKQNRQENIKGVARCNNSKGKNFKRKYHPPCKH